MSTSGVHGLLVRPRVATPSKTMATTLTFSVTTASMHLHVQGHGGSTGCTDGLKSQIANSGPTGCLPSSPLSLPLLLPAPASSPPPPPPPFFVPTARLVAGLKGRWGAFARLRASAREASGLASVPPREWSGSGGLAPELGVEAAAVSAGWADAPPAPPLRYPAPTGAVPASHLPAPRQPPIHRCPGPLPGPDSPGRAPGFWSSRWRRQAPCRCRINRGTAHPLPRRTNPVAVQRSARCSRPAPCPPAGSRRA